MTQKSMLSPQQLIEDLLGKASSDGTIVIVHQAQEVNVRFASNKLTTSGETFATSITVISIKDRAYGTCRGDVSGPSEALAILRRSEEIASRSKKAADYFDLVSREDAASLEKTFDQPFDPQDTLEFFDAVSPGIDRTFTSARKLHLLTFGYTSFRQEAVYLGTSTGVRAGYSESKTYVGMTTKTQDFTKSVWAGRTGRNLRSIEVEDSFIDCTELLGASSKTRQLDPGKYTCVLSPSCVADMILWMYWMMSLRDADEGKTAFSNRKEGGSRIGEAMYPESLSLWSDPYAPGIECVPFVVTAASHSLESVFDNGFPLSKINWIERGIQTSLVATRQYAQTKRVPPYPMVPNLLLAVGEPENQHESAGKRVPTASRSFEDAMPLISKVERGLYVNCLWYIRLVDPQTGLLTGLTRDGVFLIEDGKIVAEVNNFRFNESPVHMLASVLDAGNPSLATPREFDDVGCWVSVPPLTVADFNMSTVSEAQ